MPIAAEVNSDYLCVHGGISPHLETIEDINQINRFDEPGTSGFLCDLLWSDPCEDKESSHYKWKSNSERECSYKFGLDPVKKLLLRNNYTSIIRAHQVQLLGYKMHRWEGKD
jgi:serine/threonine-protein phosphatase 2B catalytic subunit